MRIGLVDSFFDTSHRQWAEGLRSYSRHEIKIFAGSPHHWKWKMEGGSIELAAKINAADLKCDLLIATDMVHLPHFRSLLDRKHIDVPIMMYFHENQITYPWSERDRDTKERVDRHYGWINYISACQADHIAFNSDYHHESFTRAIPEFVKPFPKFPWKEDYQGILNKSRVLPIGLELPQYNIGSDRPTFIWNHRWEYDKNAADFFEILFELDDRQFDFDLIVVGREYGNSPDVFEKARVKLENHIIHWGWIENREEYLRILQQANIALVTSNQDFFGISAVEAIAAGAYPLMPNRLAFPEHLPPGELETALYSSKDEAIIKLETIISQEMYRDSHQFSAAVQKYDWNNLIDSYDECFERVVECL